jgi:NADH-quinone oxidoreductase subunit D
LVTYIKADGTKVPARVHFKSPCLVNLTALRNMLVGHLIADIMAVFGSIDVVLGEIDR